MLDKVWYTNFPPANVQFQQPFVEAAQLLAKRNFTNAFVQLEMLERKLPKNDTLHYLKGYCLLEMGEGPDALRYFEELESRQPDWQEQLQWYRGLGLLLSGEPKIALSQFKVIAASSGHPFRLQSQKAIEMLE